MPPRTRTSAWLTPAANWGSLLAAALVLLPLSAGEPAAPPLDDPRWTWPLGPLREVLGALPADLAPLPPDTPPWPARGSEELPRPQHWNAWAEMVLTVAEQPEGAEDPAARVALTRLALEQGRGPDAWEHALALADHPAALAGLLPYLFPGVPEGASTGPAAGPGGFPGPLPAGVVLRPALPHPGDHRGPARDRSLVIENLVIGGARVSGRLVVEGDGVDVEWQHLGGPPVSFQVVLPCPPGRRFQAEYANWQRSDKIGSPLPVELRPGAEPWRLWGHFERARPLWPGHVPEGTTAQLALEGIEVLLPEDPAGLEGFAEALARLAGISAAANPGAGGGPIGAPVRIDLTEPERRGEKLVALVSLAERWLLESGVRGPRVQPRLDPPGPSGGR